MPETTTPIRDQLALAIAEASTIGCLDCGPGTCARHAADAVLDAARDQRLVILTVEAANEVVLHAQVQTAEAIATAIDAARSRAKAYHYVAALSRAADIARAARVDADDAA